MANFIKLVVSGREFPDISKQILVESSWYFRALLNGNFKDSGKEVYTFSGWSSKAFDFLLRYIVTRKIVFKGQDLTVIRAAMDISDFFLVDGFKPELSRAVISSWTDLDTNSVFQLANELCVREELEETTYSDILKVIESDQCEPVTYDMLILVTGMPKFWIFTIDTEEFLRQDVIWKKVIRRYRDLMEVAMKLPPNSGKAKSLARNLNLLLLGRRHWTRILKMLDCSSPGPKCLRIALQSRLIDSRQELRRILAHVRVPFSEGCSKTKTFGVAEFNTNSWCWKIKECQGRFASTHCVMKRNYASFLGPTGLLIIRQCNLFPEIIECAELGDIIRRYPDNITCCVSKKFIFVSYTNVDEQTLRVKKFDLFSYEFTDCASVILSEACMREHGDSVYIVGYSYEEVPELLMFEYNVRTNCTSIIFRSHCVRFPVVDILVVKRQIFIFFPEAFTIVNTLKAVNQTLEVASYTGLVRDMWDYDFMTVVLSPVGSILFLLKVFCMNWSYSELMVAQFNPVSGEITCLGMIPIASEVNPALANFYSYRPQMEVRHARHGALSDSHKIMKVINCLD